MVHTKVHHKVSQKSTGRKIRGIKIGDQQIQKLTETSGVFYQQCSPVESQVSQKPKRRHTSFFRMYTSSLRKICFFCFVIQLRCQTCYSEYMGNIFFAIIFYYFVFLLAVICLHLIVSANINILGESAMFLEKYGISHTNTHTHTPLPALVFSPEINVTPFFFPK